MDEVVLVSDADSPLGKELVERYRKGEYRVVTLHTGQGSGDNLTERSPSQLILGWNRKSPLSARNVILQVLNHFGRLDEALVILSPPEQRSLLQELSFAEVEQAVDRWVKGTLLLVKEILGLYAGPGRGNLGLVGYARVEYGGFFPPLESALRGCFRGLARSLFASSPAGIRINGFESYGSEAAAFAEFIHHTLEEKARRLTGKWFRYQRRPRLFPFRSKAL